MFLYGMKTQECVLPVRCASCGATFDLWYDLLAGEDGVKGVPAGKIREEEHLCWQCRESMPKKWEPIDVEAMDESEEDGLSLYWD